MAGDAAPVVDAGRGLGGGAAGRAARSLAENRNPEFQNCGPHPPIWGSPFTHTGFAGDFCSSIRNLS